MGDIVDPKQMADGFWNHLDKDDFSVPRVKVGQKEEQAGKFVWNSGEMSPSILNCKLLVPTKTRVLYHGKGRARCKSDNFHTPSSYVESPLSSNCLTCPISAWGENEEKEMVARQIGESVKDLNKPLCKETYNLMMVDGDNRPFIISFQGTNLKVVSEKLLSRLRYQKLAPFHVAFDMKLVRTQDARGNGYYNVAFENFREAEDKQLMSELYQQYKMRAQDVISKQHEDMDKAHDAERNVSPVPSFDSDEEIPF